MRIVFLVESLQLAGAERVVLELAQAGRNEGHEAHIITLVETGSDSVCRSADLQVGMLGACRPKDDATKTMLGACRPKGDATKTMLGACRPEDDATKTMLGACRPKGRRYKTKMSGQYRDVQRLSLFRRDEFQWSKSALAAAVRLRKALAGLRPDVVAIHTPKAAVIAALAGMRSPCVWVLHGHDICWDGATARRRVSRGLQRWAWRRLGGHVAAVSASLAEHAAEGLGMARGEIAVIPNGVDTERFRFEERSLTGDVVVCVLGRLIPAKGPGKALEAFAWLRQEFPAARLWFIGDGPMREELAAEAAARGWSKAVTLWGMLKQPEIRLRESTVLWMPSESEGFGIACVEAMASGVPVVGFDVCGVRDLLGGGWGVLTPPRDTRKLAEQTALLVRDGERYRRIAREARARVESRYSLERMCAGHYEWMLSLAGGETAQPPRREEELMKMAK